MKTSSQKSKRMRYILIGAVIILFISLIGGSLLFINTKNVAPSPAVEISQSESNASLARPPKNQGELVSVPEVTEQLNLIQYKEVASIFLENAGMFKKEREAVNTSSVEGYKSLVTENNVYDNIKNASNYLTMVKVAESDENYAVILEVQTSVSKYSKLLEEEAQVYKAFETIDQVLEYNQSKPLEENFKNQEIELEVIQKKI